MEGMLFDYLGIPSFFQCSIFFPHNFVSNYSK